MAEPTLLSVLGTQSELILEAIYPDARSLLRFSRVCRATRAAVKLSSVWKRFCFDGRVFSDQGGSLTTNVVMKESMITPARAIELLMRESAFRNGRFRVKLELKYESSMKSDQCLTSSFLVNVSKAGDSVEILDFCSTSLTPTRALIPFGAKPEYRQYLLHALPKDQILLARFGGGINPPAPLLVVCNLKAAKADPNDQAAWLNLSTMLPLNATIAAIPWHSLSVVSPVFVISEDAGASGTVCTIFATTDGRDLKILSKFLVPLKHVGMSVVVDCQPERPVHFTANGYPPDEQIAPPQGMRTAPKQLLIIDDKGRIKAKMMEPVQAWHKGESCYAAVRADGTAVLLFSILAGGHSRTEVYHVSLAATAELSPAILEPTLASKANEHFLCMCPVPAMGQRGSSPLFLCGISGLGKIQLIDPFDLTTEPDRRSVKDSQGRLIPILLTNATEPHANVIYMAMPQKWGKRVNSLTVRGRYAVVSLDETFTLFDWITGEYLWRDNVALGAHPDDSPIAALRVSPDGCTVFASLYDGRSVLCSIHTSRAAPEPSRIPSPSPTAMTPAAVPAPAPTAKRARGSEDKPLLRGRDHD